MSDINHIPIMKLPPMDGEIYRTNGTECRPKIEPRHLIDTSRQQVMPPIEDGYVSSLEREPVFELPEDEGVFVVIGTNMRRQG